MGKVVGGGEGRGYWDDDTWRVVISLRKRGCCFCCVERDSR